MLLAQQRPPNTRFELLVPPHPRAYAQDDEDPVTHGDPDEAEEGAWGQRENHGVVVAPVFASCGAGVAYYASEG